MRKRQKFAVINGSRKKKKNGDTILYILMVSAVSLLVLQTAYSFAREVLAGVFMKTVISEQTTLEQTVSANGVIVRNEHAVAAPLTGTVKWLVDDGERVGTGAKVAVITAENGTTAAVYSPWSGIVIRELDGLEGVLQAQSLAGVDLAQTKKMRQKVHMIAEGEGVRQGSMLFKVVDNYLWYFVAELSAEEYASLPEKGRGPLRFDFSAHDEVQAHWSLLAEEEERVLLAFEVKNEMPGSFLQRFAVADIVISRTTGLVLPAKALVLHGEETGVYVLDKSVVRYRPVDVVEAAGNRVVVEGVPAGYSVITNPGLFREGQRL